jgi:hypothetical protein
LTQTPGALVEAGFRVSHTFILYTITLFVNTLTNNYQAGSDLNQKQLDPQVLKKLNFHTKTINTQKGDLNRDS